MDFCYDVAARADHSSTTGEALIRVPFVDDHRPEKISENDVRGGPNGGPKNSKKENLMFEIGFMYFQL